MTRLERRLVGTLLQELPRSGTKRLLEQLIEAGLLDLTACERLAMRRQVELLVRQGGRRTAAMVQVAETFGCSYEKVRAAVYRKR